MYTNQINQFYDAILDGGNNYNDMYAKFRSRYPAIAAAHFEILDVLITKDHYNKLSSQEQIALIRRAMHVRMQLHNIYEGR